MDYLRWMVSLPLLVACGGRAPATTSAPAATGAAAAPSATAPVAEVPAPVHRRGGTKLVVEVGPAGGTLELDNGARVDIPPGALDDLLELTFAEGTRTTAFSNKEFERPLGPTLELAPELAPSVPLRLSIPLTKVPEGFAEKDLALGVEGVSTTQRAVQGQGLQTRWDYHPASAAHGRAVAELARVPGLRVQFLVSRSE